MGRLSPLTPPSRVEIKTRHGHIYIKTLSTTSAVCALVVFCGLLSFGLIIQLYLKTSSFSVIGAVVFSAFIAIVFSLFAFFLLVEFDSFTVTPSRQFHLYQRTSFFTNRRTGDIDEMRIYVSSCTLMRGRSTYWTGKVVVGVIDSSEYMAFGFFINDVDAEEFVLALPPTLGDLFAGAGDRIVAPVGYKLLF